MNKNKLTFLKVAIVAVLGVATILGCEKEEVLQEREVEKTESSSVEVSVEVLRGYLANKVNAQLNWISFDEKTDMFRLHGIDQISRTDLTGNYKRDLLNP